MAPEAWGEQPVCSPFPLRAPHFTAPYPLPSRTIREAAQRPSRGSVAQFSHLTLFIACQIRPALLVNVQDHLGRIGRVDLDRDLGAGLELRDVDHGNDRLGLDLVG